LHFIGPKAWPDLTHWSRCALHDVLLEVELGADGYKEGEWFCRDFVASADGRASKAAVIHLQEIRDHLRSDVLYGFYGSDGNLREYEFKELRPAEQELPPGAPEKPARG
jgi:hypothetical protein